MSKSTRSNKHIIYKEDQLKIKKGGKRVYKYTYANADKAFYYLQDSIQCDEHGDPEGEFEAHELAEGD